MMKTIETKNEPCFIKVRKKGGKAWAFLSRKGTNYLRIHALQFDERAKAQGLIDDNQADNPEWEFKIVEAAA